MTQQLSRQLELNISALSRGFRQALRYALKNDPQGTEETSPAWKTVAARQALLLTMLSAVGEFLNPQVERPMQPALDPVEPQEPALAPLADPEPPAPAFTLLDACNEADAEETDISDEELLALLPPEILSVREEILEVMKWPIENRQEKRRQAREFHRLQGVLERRFQQWKTELAAKAEEAL